MFAEASSWSRRLCGAAGSWPEQLTARAGDALRIGGADDVIPGLTTWGVLAPEGAAAMLAIPADPTDCAAWLPDAGPVTGVPSPANGAGAPPKPPGAPVVTPRVRATDGGCVLDTGAFVIAGVPLVPDADRVIDRSLRAGVCDRRSPAGPAHRPRARGAA